MDPILPPQRNASCFVSYCHQDIDRDVLEWLIGRMRAHGKERLNLYFDVEVAYGKNWAEFMDLVDRIDVIVILMTPKYKEKVLNREPGGVYEEWKRISLKFEQTLLNAKPGIDQPLTVIPILLSGTAASSVPPGIAGTNWLDLTGLVVARNREGKLVAPAAAMLRYDQSVKDITAAVLAKALFEDESYHAEQIKLRRELYLNECDEQPAPEDPPSAAVGAKDNWRLVDIVKHSDEDMLKSPAYRDVLIETAAFRKVQQQGSYLIIGRKGSGKSTLTSMLELGLKERYSGTIHLRAENVNLEAAVTNTDRGSWSDIEQILKPLVYFAYGWQSFFVLCLVELLGRLDEANVLRVEQRRYMAPIRSFLKGQPWWKKSRDIVQSALFDQATKELHRFLMKSIAGIPNTVKDTSVESSLIAAFDFESFVGTLIGEKARRALGRIVSHCPRKVLVTLDDFDTIFDRFRDKAPDADKRWRSEVEREWLRALLLMVADIKSNQDTVPQYFRTLDFCLTIPRDRYLEIERTDRDAYLHSRATTNILWSGMELCELLTRRMEKVTGHGGPLVGPPEEQLEAILQRDWPQIPRELEFQFNSRKLSISLFLYVLRHTFWRPRDVLIYFANILAAARDVAREGRVMSTEFVRRIVSETTHGIIQTDFLQEYSRTIWGLPEVLRKFIGASQVLSFDAVEERIRHISFGVSVGGNYELKINEKIELLYDIGFLGIVLDDRMKDRFQVQCNEAFYFNEGRTVLRAVINSGYMGTRFAVHPIFSESLNLDYSKNDLLLFFSWNYVREHRPVFTNANV